MANAHKDWIFGPPGGNPPGGNFTTMANQCTSQYRMSQCQITPGRYCNIIAVGCKVTQECLPPLLSSSSDSHIWWWWWILTIGFKNGPTISCQLCAHYLRVVVYSMVQLL